MSTLQLARPAQAEQAHWSERPLAATSPERTQARWGLALVLLLFAYEWFLSGMNKLLSASFRTGLAAQLQSSLAGNPNHWYADLVSKWVVPHASLAGLVVVSGELLVAGGLVGGAIWQIFQERLGARWGPILHYGAIGALLGSALMTANYYLLAGGTTPWLQTSNPFNEGLSIDGLMTLVAAALLVVHLPLPARPSRSRQNPRGR